MELIQQTILGRTLIFSEKIESENTQTCTLKVVILKSCDLDFKLRVQITQFTDAAKRVYDLTRP